MGRLGIIIDARDTKPLATNGDYADVWIASRIPPVPPPANTPKYGLHLVEGDLPQRIAAETQR